MSSIVVPVDPIDLVVTWLKTLVTQVPDLAGLSVGGTMLTPGVTPDNYIRVMIVGNSDYHRVGDRVSVRIQVWKSGTEKRRNSITNQILAHTRAKLAGRKEAGPFSIPDQADPTKYLTQFEVSILLIGVQS